jgi:hypothetical protein
VFGVVKIGPGRQQALLGQEAFQVMVAGFGQMDLTGLLNSALVP